MAKLERGTKRTDPETGKKFYDLNQDPVVSPYTGKSYPRSFFEQATAGTAGKPAPARRAEKKPVVEDTEDETDEVEADGPEVISLEDAEPKDEADSDDDEKSTDDAEVEVEVEDDSDDDDVFLEDDDDDDAAEDFDIDVDNDDDR